MIAHCTYRRPRLLRPSHASCALRLFLIKTTAATAAAAVGAAVCPVLGVAVSNDCFRRTLQHRVDVVVVATVVVVVVVRFVFSVRRLLARNECTVAPRVVPIVTATTTATTATTTTASATTAAAANATANAAASAAAGCVVRRRSPSERR
jgi:hypothetical protein